MKGSNGRQNKMSVFSRLYVLSRSTGNLPLSQYRPV